MLGFKKNITGSDGDVLTREIAERCAKVILAQLSSGAQQMNPAQLRGYVRARVCSHVSAEVQDAVETGRVRRSRRAAGRADRIEPFAASVRGHTTSAGASADVAPAARRAASGLGRRAVAGARPTPGG